MAIVEKKYLLRESIYTFLKDMDVEKSRITQFYTAIALCREIRYRQEDDHFYKTIRTGREVRENEIDESITPKIYQNSQKKKIGKVLKKRHQTFAHEGKTYTLVTYKKQLSGILMLEVLFDSVDEADTFVLPEALKTHLLKDVSHNDRYRNKNLSLLGNPQKISYNIYAIFKAIERGRFEGVSETIFPEMGVSDSIRIILYEQIQILKNRRDTLLKENDIQALEEFRETISHTHTILDTYQRIFDKNLFKKVCTHLSLIEKTISTNKDLLVIRHNLSMLEGGFSEQEINSFIAGIDKRIEKEKQRIKSFFKTREFSIIFRQLELLVKEQSNIYTSHYANTAILSVAKKSIYKTLKTFLKTSNNYALCHDMDSYESMQKELLKTINLVSKFAHFYPAGQLQTMQTLLHNTNDAITEFIELHKRSLIIKTYITHSHKSEDEKHYLLDKIQNQRSIMEQNITHKIDNNIDIMIKQRKIFSPKKWKTNPTQHS